MVDLKRMQAELLAKREALITVVASHFRQYQATKAELDKVDAALDALRGAERGIRMALEILENDRKVGGPA